jgi:hypothetical protein
LNEELMTTQILSEDEVLGFGSEHNPAVWSKHRTMLADPSGLDEVLDSLRSNSKVSRRAVFDIVDANSKLAVIASTLAIAIYAGLRQAFDPARASIGIRTPVGYPLVRAIPLDHSRTMGRFNLPSSRGVGLHKTNCTRTEASPQVGASEGVSFAQPSWSSAPASHRRVVAIHSSRPCPFGRYALFGEVTYRASFDHPDDNHGYKGTGGFRVTW